MVVVEIQYAIEGGDFPSPTDIDTWVQSAFPGTSRGELTVRIVDGEEIRQLNSDYRQIDKTTNVLSFPADWNLEEGLPYLGDIAICAEVVEREALEQGKPPRAHWAHMVIHGALHLQGYDHQTDDGAEAMEAHEISLLAQHNFDNPYASNWLTDNAQDNSVSNERRTG